MKCCVVFCGSDSGKKDHPEGEPIISFHRFPNCPEIRKKWIEAIKRLNWQPNAEHRICSKHFKTSDFMNYNKKIRRLKPIAVPSVFDGSGYITKDESEPELIQYTPDFIPDKNMRLEAVKKQSARRLKKLKAMRAKHKRLEVKMKKLTNLDFTRRKKTGGRPKPNIHTTKEINREEICSACLEYQSQVVQISDDNIKQVFKSFTDDYQIDELLYLCYYCKYTFTEMSTFKTICLQSYLFLTKYRHCLKFDCDLLTEMKKRIKSNIDLNSSEPVNYPSQNDDFININDPLGSFKLKEEKIEETRISNIDIKVEIINEDYHSSENNFTEFKEDTVKSKTEETNNDISYVELPIEFDNKTRNLHNKKSAKVKMPDEVKKCEEIADFVKENMIEIKLSREQQIKHMEEKRQSEKYLQAIYKCEDCAQSFELIMSLEKHLKRHDKSQGSNECWLCHMRFPEVSQLISHSVLHSTRLLCKLCDYESHKYQYMKDHLQGHAGVTHPCRLCDKVFKTRKTLSEHLKGSLHKKKNLKRNFKCQLCDKAFLKKEVLLKHEFFHRNIRPYGCETCGKAFQTKTRLKLHMNSHKEKSNEFYCVECDMYFKSENLLKNHLENSLKHTDPSLLIFECKQCLKKFKLQKMLDSHIKTAHEKTIRYFCDTCGVSFAHHHNLKSHMRRVHEGIIEPRKYECSTCNKRFSSKPMLSNHFRVHTGERPFQCDLCEWKFKQKSTLMTHIKSKHLNIKKNVITKKSKKETQTLVPD